jgi:hypothetical protein
MIHKRMEEYLKIPEFSTRLGVRRRNDVYAE